MDATEYVATLAEIENMSHGTNLVKDFLNRYPDDFISTLRSWIQFGEKRCDMCMLMVYMLKYEDKGYLLKSPMESDQSILHLAATFHDCQRLVTTLLKMEPELAEQIRFGPHFGLTPLHIIVSKGDCDTTEAYLESLDNPGVIMYSLMRQATGSRFTGTLLMGETALSAAILKFVPEEISTDSTDTLQLAKVLLAQGAGFHDQNSRGDTVIHTLIRYAHLYPERREQVMDMMAEIQSYLLKSGSKDKTTHGRLYARRLWFCQNSDQMTALQLAATLGEHEIVRFIMELQWVYRTLHDYDGIFETNKYDITEIDTLAKIEWCKNQEKNYSQILYGRESLWTKLQRFVLCYDSVVARRSTPAILEVICEVEVEAACSIISTPVVNKLIDAKWRKYKLWFYSWAITYILSLLFLSLYASLKFRYVEFLGKSENNNETTEGIFSGNFSENPVAAIRFAPDTLVKPPETHKLIITIGCFFALSISILSIYLECVRSFVQRKPWNLLLVHHNGSYRLLLLLNALVLGVDSVWFLISPATNDKTPLVLALLFGWWFTTFFLRPFKKFSFFTVMLMKVLLGDMLRFFTIIIIALASFTMAMHVLFINGESLPKQFESLPLGCLTMFKLMLGLTDLEILEHANPVWLAMALFVIYVLLTYVLLINSLIAMMSNTCSEIAGQKSNQWKIQRLSVILFIENMMLCGLVQTSGRKNYFRKNDEGDKVEARYVIEDTKLSVLDKHGNLGHDLHAKGMFVSSRPLNKRLASDSEKDLWSLSDELSPNSEKSSYAASNVSLAESFVVNLGKKYRQVSKRSRSSWPKADDSTESESSFGSVKESKRFSKMFRRNIKKKKLPKSEDNDRASQAGLEFSDESDDDYVPQKFEGPLKSILSKPKTGSINSVQQKSSNESLPIQTSQIVRNVPESDSMRQSQNERLSPEPAEFQHLTDEINRSAENESVERDIEQMSTIEEFRKRSSVTPQSKDEDNLELTGVTSNALPESIAQHSTSESHTESPTVTQQFPHDATVAIPDPARENDTIELDTLLENLDAGLQKPERDLYPLPVLGNLKQVPRRAIGELIESHAPESKETVLMDKRISQDSTDLFEYIDEIKDDKETPLLLHGDNDQLKVETPYKGTTLSRGEYANIESLNNNEVNEPKPHTSSYMGDTNEEENKAETKSTDIVEKEIQGKTENTKATGTGGRERDQHWLALLKSIRNLDRDRYSRSTDRRRPSKSICDIKQRRNAFIKGLGSSHDYNTVMESEDSI